MIRLQVSVPHGAAEVYRGIAAAAGISISSLIRDALALYLQAVTLARAGHRLAVVDPDHQRVCEITTEVLEAVHLARKAEPKADA